MRKRKKLVLSYNDMVFQILHYEFLGPVPMSQWGPPMEKILYIVLSRDKDRFNILYVDDCEKTDEKSFFVQHDKFKCWMQHVSSEESLYLAVLPMFNSNRSHRLGVVDRILSHYKPPCNDATTTASASSKSPEYKIRKDTIPKPRGYKCPCCGSEMSPEKTLRASTLYRCTGCGMSDTRAN